jgi:hypothetical protein
MAKDTSLSVQTAPISRTTASLSFAGAATFLVLLTALHFIKPELDPSWRFISEYAIGDSGWIMVLAFLSLALSYASLFFAIRSQTRTFGGKIGLASLLVSAAGLTIAGIFTTDPITASIDAMTAEGNLHNLGGTLGMAMPIAAVLISWSLARNPAWAPARRSLIGAAALAMIGFLASFLSIGLMLSQSGGNFGPGVLVGWTNRLEVLTYSIWLMVVAWQATRLTRLRD